MKLSETKNLELTDLNWVFHDIKYHNQNSYNLN